jgi:DNA repair photolyase
VRALPEKNPESPWESRFVEYLGEPPATPLEIHEDDTRSILSKNDSPDVGFRFSVNPYRGCYHGCAYCYARPTHEYLGFGAGTDFERKIVVKVRAVELLRKELTRRSWKRETVVFSGNTDCYQPIEATYRLTRGCLAVCADLENPVHVITKAPLVERDLDVLVPLAERQLVGVTISVPFWDEAAARLVEPGVATPARRLLAVERLARAGIPVSVNVAPVIPGLTDRDIPKILEAAARAGARSAAMIMLRLPGNVAPVFEARLRESFPLSADKVLVRTREVRGGRLNDPSFGSRMRGSGEYAEAIRSLFHATARRVGLEPHDDDEAARAMTRAPSSGESGPVAPQPPASRQLSLFGEPER